MANQNNIICYPFDATPENVVLYPMPQPDAPTPVMVYLARRDILPTFPNPGNVVAGVKYGPSGVELTGTYAGTTGGGGAFLRRR